jgi:DNA-binding transcriptional regulator YiaG
LPVFLDRSIRIHNNICNIPDERRFFMNSIARLLKETIERSVKKQVRSETRALRKASAHHRKTIADLNTRLREIDRELTLLRKQHAASLSADSRKESGNLRFSAKGLQSMRKKLALSARESGILLGVSARMIGKWESGLARPTEEQIVGIAGLRSIGKREARMRLEEKIRIKK